MHVGSGKTQGGLGFWKGGYRGPDGEQGELVYKQPGTEVDDSLSQLGGFQVSKRGYKGEERGNQQGEIKAREMCHV
jgi:hypothetical protein